MGRTLQFRMLCHREAYEKLTIRQKQYIASYMITRSPSKVAMELKLNASPHSISKTIRQCTKRMGLSSVRELVGKEQSTTAADLKKLIEAQEFRCALSGELLTPDTASLDHIVPVSNGGGNEVDNLQWLNAEVNTMKGSLSQERFIALCRKIASWNG